MTLDIVVLYTIIAQYMGFKKSVINTLLHESVDKFTFLQVKKGLVKELRPPILVPHLLLLRLWLRID